MPDKLRLRAADAEDLAVIAACLQDARIPLKEMVFLPDEKRFVAAFTRYRREKQKDWSNCEGLTECASALVFDGIDEVKYRGVDKSAPDKEMELLTIATAPGPQHLIHIELVFAGGSEIQLRTHAINCRLDDFGAPVPCRVVPCDHFTTPVPGWTEPYAEKT